MPHTAWAVPEMEALVGFIVSLRRERWPSSTDHAFWAKASLFMNECGRDRTGRELTLYYVAVVDLKIIMCVGVWVCVCVCVLKL